MYSMELAKMGGPVEEEMRTELGNHEISRARDIGSTGAGDARC